MAHSHLKLVPYRSGRSKDLAQGEEQITSGDQPGDGDVRVTQKITFAEMRAAGVRNVLIYCSDLQMRPLQHRCR
jgi:hypothetical protein